ncbi:TraR/DksA C4-type zinc finger protein [Serratia sp. T13T92]|uniref:TraR/DksA C4-type zinc finger protein n=1 Tax=Serratia sp. T13T92 TaxID=3397496 RepID=UPI0039DFA965
MIECALNAVRLTLTAGSSESLLNCSDCDARIPVPRRQLLPGVQTCVTCQERREFYQRVGNLPPHSHG